MDHLLVSKETFPVTTAQAATSKSWTLQVLKSAMDTLMWCRSCGFSLSTERPFPLGCR